MHKTSSGENETLRLLVFTLVAQMLINIQIVTRKSGKYSCFFLSLPLPLKSNHPPIDSFI